MASIPVILWHSSVSGENSQRPAAMALGTTAALPGAPGPGAVGAWDALGALAAAGLTRG